LKVNLTLESPTVLDRNKKHIVIFAFGQAASPGTELMKCGWQPRLIKIQDTGALFSKQYTPIKEPVIHSQKSFVNDYTAIMSWKRTLRPKLVSNRLVCAASRPFVDPDGM
jgi:hypothetical protein